MSQSVERPISAEVIILQFVGSGPASGSGADSWEPGAWSLLGILCLPLSLCPSPGLCSLALSLSKTNKHLKKFVGSKKILELAIFFNYHLHCGFFHTVPTLSLASKLLSINKVIRKR